MTEVTADKRAIGLYDDPMGVAVLDNVMLLAERMELKAEVRVKNQEVHEKMRTSI